MHYKYTDIKAIVAEILENKKDEGGVKNIYFVGCGGSLGALYPAKTFMERESLTLKSGWVSSNEFVHSHAPRFRQEFHHLPWPATRATLPRPLPLQSWARRWAPLSSS